MAMGDRTRRSRRLGRTKAQTRSRACLVSKSASKRKTTSAVSGDGCFARAATAGAAAGVRARRNPHRHQPRWATRFDSARHDRRWAARHVDPDSATINACACARFRGGHCLSACSAAVTGHAKGGDQYRGAGAHPARARALYRQPKQGDWDETRLAGRTQRLLRSAGPTGLPQRPAAEQLVPAWGATWRHLVGRQSEHRDRAAQLNTLRASPAAAAGNTAS